MSAQATENNVVRVGRVATLQPPKDLSAFDSPVEQLNTALSLREVKHIVQFWAQGRKELPDDFWEMVEVTSLHRQPVMFVCVDAQRVHRKLKPRDVPYNGGDVNQDRWSTDDLFRLAPVNALDFPDKKTSFENELAGQEEVRVCNPCGGAGKTSCNRCRGSGKTTCSSCRGHGEIECGQCDGAGEVISGGESLVTCEACSGTGTKRCTTCREHGTVDCSTCRGEGTLHCKTCDGKGNIKRSWVLVTETRTLGRHESELRDPWPVTTDALLPYTVELHRSQFPWPYISNSVGELNDSLPTNVLGPSRKLIESVLSDERPNNDKSTQITGVQLRILGTYLHRAEIVYKEEVGTLFLSATDNCLVVPHELPYERWTFGRALKRISNRLFSSISLDERDGLSPEYMATVQEGRAHLSDTNIIFPKLRNFGLQVARSSFGYSITVPSENGEPRGEGVKFDVQFDVSRAGDLIASTSYRFGQAHRDQFPRALMINHELPFGHLAVVADVNTKQEYFSLVDRRIYESLVPELYYCVLMEMSVTVQEIENNKTLR